MFDLQQIQQALREFEFDAWLLCDFRGNNLLARRVLDLADAPITSRRFFYCIPARGTPKKLVHRIEQGALEHLPGDSVTYLKWQELEAGLAALLDGVKTAAMEYSPRNANPYVARVDAGTVELVRDLGVEVASSGDLIQLFEATWDDEQWDLHLQASQHTNSAFDLAWTRIAHAVRDGKRIEEEAVQDFIVKHFADHNMVTYHPPIVAVGPNSGNPHYETGEGSETQIGEGDFVLIDLWAKLDRPRGVYSDLTRVGYVGERVPEKFEDVFQIVARARDAAIDCVRRAMNENRVLQGWEVDQAARDVIDQAGYGDAFIHRTGHSIGAETHGNGANMDNLETREERRVMRRTCFSIEPGIYLPEFGIRSEVDVFVDAEGNVHVTGGEVQTSVLPILSRY